MTLPRLDAFLSRWETVPPMSVTALRIGDALGAERIKPGRSKKAATKPENNLQALADDLGQFGMTMSKRPEWTK